MNVSKEIKIKNGLVFLFVCLMILAGIFLAKGFLEGQFESVETFQKYIGRYGLFAPIVLALIQMLQVVLPVLPGFLGCAAGAAMFGSVVGFWCNYIGISAGSVIAFFLAKWLGDNLVSLMVSKEKYYSLVKWINKKKSYTLILFLSILLPLAPDDFLCYFSGLAGMSSRKFVWIILLAKPWCILFYSIFFGQLFG